MGRAALTAALVALVALPAAAPAHPGHANQVSVGNGRFDPATVRIRTGTVVTWHWDWPGDLEHTVTADSGSFDSDPDGNPDHLILDTFSYRFSEVGTFTYYCRIDPTMRGTIVVSPRPTAPGPTTPATPSPGGSPDVTLELGDVRVGARRKRIGFTVSYASTVKVRVARRGRSHWRMLRAYEVAADAGRNRVRLRPRVLDPGRYRVRLAARDGAGNRSGALFARFRVERR